METERVTKCFQKFGMKKRKKPGQELEGEKDCLRFVFLFIWMRKVSWEFRKTGGGEGIAERQLMKSVPEKGEGCRLST